MPSFADRARMPGAARIAVGGNRAPLHLPRPPWAPVDRVDRPRSASAEAERGRAAAPNRTGLPDALKTGVEALSGLAMDDVRVHRDSPEPARLGALAYAQGSDIHLARGEEEHLAHEAWHVVQQKQGRVAATSTTQDSPINEAESLEREADAMGRLAAAGPALLQPPLEHISSASNGIRQMMRPSDLAEARDRASRINAAIETTVAEPRIAHDVDSSFENWLDGMSEEPNSLNCWQYVLYLGVKWGGFTRAQLRERMNSLNPDVRLDQNDIFSGGVDYWFRDAGDASFQLGDAIVLDYPDRHTFVSLGGQAVADLGGNLVSPTITDFARIHEKHRTDIGLRNQSFKLLKLSRFISSLPANDALRFKLDEMYAAVNSPEDLENREGEFTDDEWARIPRDLFSSDLNVKVVPYAEWTSRII